AGALREDARAGARRADAGDVVDGAVAVVVDHVADLGRLGDRADAGLGAGGAGAARLRALPGAALAARTGAGVVAVGEVAGRAAGGADPRVLRIVVGAGVAVVVEAVAELGRRRDQAQARAVDRRRVGAGLARRPARGAGAGDAARRQGGAAQRQRLALLDAVVADADAVLAHRQRVG